MTKGRKSKYQVEYASRLIEHFREGYSFESFAGIVGVSRATIYNWLEKYESFVEAKQVGESLSLLFWERVGIEGMFQSSRDFNSKLYMINFRNRFGAPEQNKETSIKLAYKLGSSEETIINVPNEKCLKL